MAETVLQSLTELMPLEANATGFDEITQFTVLRESNGRRLTPSTPSKIVVDGDPASGLPILKISRPIS